MVILILEIILKYQEIIMKIKINKQYNIYVVWHVIVQWTHI